MFIYWSGSISSQTGNKAKDVVGDSCNNGEGRLKWTVFDERGEVLERTRGIESAELKVIFYNFKLSSLIFLKWEAAGVVD